ncbi:MAG TPA: NUDIX domain-containing protein [Acidimicrobiales bacterium]|nr:NUDIX domain-containing protein [Acidimicrobiales bacterium]
MATVSRSGGQQRGDRRWPAGLLGVVHDTVARHTPVDARERQARLRILESLDLLPRPFDEEADPVHVTGSAVVVGSRGTVLHKHKRLHRWMQPGGHIDPGESPWDAALRESEEETGLTVRHPVEGPRLLHLDVHEAAKGHTHLDLRYLLVAPDEDPAPPPGESPEARWYTWDEAKAVADEALAGALEVARRQSEVGDGARQDGNGPGGHHRSDAGRGGGESR